MKKIRTSEDVLKEIELEIKKFEKYEVLNNFFVKFPKTKKSFYFSLDIKLWNNLYFLSEKQIYNNIYKCINLILPIISSETKEQMWINFKNLLLQYNTETWFDDFVADHYLNSNVPLLWILLQWIENRELYVNEKVWDFLEIIDLLVLSVIWEYVYKGKDYNWNLLLKEINEAF